MKRKDFLKLALAAPFTGIAMKLNALNQYTDDLPNSPEMPVLFLGHGSPMNAIEENEFVTGFRNISKQIEKPSAVLCVSAHWETMGTKITAMESPRTIHDFGGFPKELFEVEYPAPGDPELAISIQSLYTQTHVELDHQWGLDHGTWSVVKHLYPKADVPVLQLSLDRKMNPQQHYDLAALLKSLRKKGVLIIGSGNMVHNLRMVAWDKLNEDDYGFDWAIEASGKMKSFIQNDDHKSLIDFKNQGKAFDLAINSAEHYLPMLYTLALKNKMDELQFFNDKEMGGSLSMTSFMLGRTESRSE